jgi:hypothetical protein
MSFYGLNVYTRRGIATKTLKGFAGVRIGYAGVPVVVRDNRGRGLAGVTLFAPNPTSSLPFETQTDGSGSAILSIDNNSTIEVTKGMITKTVNYTTENQVVIILDTNFLQGF